MIEGSDDALIRALKAQRSVGKTGANWDNRAIARNIIQLETGKFPAELQTVYEFDEAVRDRLLAHSREDVAHALCNTASLLRSLRILQLQSAIFGIGTVGQLIVIVWKLFY